MRTKRSISQEQPSRWHELIIQDQWANLTFVFVSFRVNESKKIKDTVEGRSSCNIGLVQQSFVRQRGYL